MSIISATTHEKEVTDLPGRDLTATKNNSLATIDIPLKVDDSQVWGSNIDSPYVVLHIILTHNIKDVESFSQLEDGKKSVDCQGKVDVVRDVDLSPRAIKPTKITKRGRKQVNTRMSQPSRTQSKKNEGSLKVQKSTKSIIWNIISVRSQKAFQRVQMLHKYHKFDFIALLEPFQHTRTINRYKSKI